LSSRTAAGLKSTADATARITPAASILTGRPRVHADGEERSSQSATQLESTVIRSAIDTGQALGRRRKLTTSPAAAAPIASTR
jgi:hypothetical protein